MRVRRSCNDQNFLRLTTLAQELVHSARGKFSASDLIFEMIINLFRNTIGIKTDVKMQA